MKTFVIHNVLTNDNKKVTVGVQCEGDIDTTLAQSIEQYVNSSMNMQQAVSNADPCYRSAANIVDGTGNKRTFDTCFMLTFDANYQTVIDSKLVSFIEH